MRASQCAAWMFLHSWFVTSENMLGSQRERSWCEALIFSLSTDREITSVLEASSPGAPPIWATHNSHVHLPPPFPPPISATHNSHVHLPPPFPPPPKIHWGSHLLYFPQWNTEGPKYRVKKRSQGCHWHQNKTRAPIRPTHRFLFPSRFAPFYGQESVVQKPTNVFLEWISLILAVHDGFLWFESFPDSPAHPQEAPWGSASSTLKVFMLCS